MIKTIAFSMLLLVLPATQTFATADGCKTALSKDYKAVFDENGYAIVYVPSELFYQYKDAREFSESDLVKVGVIKEGQKYSDLLKPNEFLLLREAKFEEIDKNKQNDGENDIVFQLKPRFIKEPERGVKRTYGEAYLTRITLPVMDDSNKIKFRNLEQKLYYLLLMDPNITMVAVRGAAGSGKTMIAVLAGLNLRTRTQADNKNKQSKQNNDVKGNNEKPKFTIDRVRNITVTRRPLEMGDGIGFLPGDETEKMINFLRPFITSIEQIKGARTAGNSNSPTGSLNLPQELVLLPYSHIRGATVADSLMVIDEAQNSPLHDFRTLITRTGEGSKFLLLGDEGQIDDPKLDRTNNALSVARRKFRRDNIWITVAIKLPFSVRSELAALAQEIFDEMDVTEEANQPAQKQK